MDIIKYHESLISDYLSKKSKICCNGSIEEYTAEQANIENAIKVAVLSRNRNGKKHFHQWRIYNYVYDDFINKLFHAKDKIKHSKNFDDLISIIEENSPSRAGELFNYDTALRIGHYLKKLPEKIYIHAGTRKGLNKLFNRKIREKAMLKKDLPEPFNSCELSEDQLEDFFCSYKKNICGKNESFSQVKDIPKPEVC